VPMEASLKCSAFYAFVRIPSRARTARLLSPTAMRSNGVYVNPSTFRDRKDAGQLLAGRLAVRRYAQPVVIALSRGGVPVAFEIAKLLEAPLDVVLFGNGIAGTDDTPPRRASPRIDQG